MRGIFILLILLSSLLVKSDTLDICQGSSVSYKEFNPPGSLVSVSWEWKFEGGVPGSSTLREPQNILYPDTGIFLTSCASTFSNGKKDTQYTYIRVISAVFDPITLRDTVLCTVNLLLDPKNEYPGYFYLWTSPTGSLSYPYIETRTLLVTKAGQYQIRVFTKTKAGLQCGFITKIITVSDSSIPKFNILGNTFICENTTTLYPDILKILSYKYLWNTTYNGSSFTTDQTGFYSLKIYNSFGCESTSNILVKDSCPPVMFFPNAFTPGNDDHNDLNEVYLPYLRGIVSFKMTIFNRWGEKLFETTDQSVGWNGTYNGSDAQLGVYLAVFELTENSGKKHIIKKSVHLLR